MFASTVAGIGDRQMTAVDPSASQVFGLSLGTWNGSSCQVVIANDAAVLNSIVTGQVTAATNLCARVYDVGQAHRPPRRTRSPSFIPRDTQAVARAAHAGGSVHSPIAFCGASSDRLT